MSDIRIIRRRNAAHVLGISRKGFMWIIDNFDDVEVKVDIGIEHVDEVVETMERVGIDVKVQ